MAKLRLSRELTRERDVTGEMTCSLAFWGDTTQTTDAWVGWLDLMERASERLQAPLSHIGVTGAGFSAKAVGGRRGVPRLRKALNSGRSVRRVSGYSVPASFATVAFDYQLHMVRGGGSIVLTAATSLADDVADVLCGLRDAVREHIAVRRGELFFLSKQELPFFYVNGDAAPEGFSTLRVVERY